jgi:hypothetical protein
MLTGFTIETTSLKLRGIVWDQNDFEKILLNVKFIDRIFSKFYSRNLQRNNSSFGRLYLHLKVLEATLLYSP